MLPKTPKPHKAALTYKCLKNTFKFIILKACQYNC